MDNNNKKSRRDVIKALTASSAVGIGFSGKAIADVEQESDNNLDPGGGGGCTTPLCQPRNDTDFSWAIHEDYAIETEVGSRLEYRGGAKADDWIFQFTTSCFAVNAHNTSNGYEHLDIFDGYTGLKVIVEEEYQADVSTQFQGDADWGVAFVSEVQGTGDHADQMMDTLEALWSYADSAAATAVTLSSIYDFWNEGVDNTTYAGIDASWPDYQPVPKETAGHTVLYTHFVSPELEGTSIDVSFENWMDRVLYIEDGITKDGIRPYATDDYSHSTEYTLIVPDDEDDENLIETQNGTTMEVKTEEEKVKNLNPTLREQFLKQGYDETELVETLPPSSIIFG